MTRLYLPLPLAVGATFELPEPAARHLVQVLRMGAGEALTVFDGASDGEYAARLVEVGRRTASVVVEGFDPVQREARLAVTIAQCVSKGDRMDYALQKATELGAAAFAPVLSERGVVKLDGERWEKKLEHWRGVVVSACEQSGRTRVPTVALPEAFDAFVSAPRAGLKLVLAPGGATSTAALDLVGADGMPRAPVTALIGPEGGFGEMELRIAARYGWQSLALGPRVLRTETAPVAVLAALLTRTGEL